MKFSVSPHTHPESPISGSTVEAMINRAAALGRTHFAYTDPAYMTSLFRAYEYTKKFDGKTDKKGKVWPLLKFIPGIEIFFKDVNCDIVKDSQAEKAKYFKITLYARDQKAFSRLSELSSLEREQTIVHYGEVYPVWGWEDLKKCAEEGVVACSSDVHDMVAKTLLTNSPQVGERVLLKLKALFGDNYYICLVGNENTHSWVNLVEITLVSGKRDVIYANSRVVTNAAKYAQAKELVLNPNKHYLLASYEKNFVTRSLGKGEKIAQAKAHSGFLKFPEGDVQLRANKFLYALSKRHNIKVLYSDYAFYAEPEDKAVQDVRLSQDDIKEHTKRHMQSSEEAFDYLTKKLGLPEAAATEILNENSAWAESFNGFKLEFDYRVPEVPGGKAPLDLCLEIIKNTGRLPKDRPEYIDRLKYEISVLAKNGKVDLTPYFLPIRDVLDFYNENGQLTGPGRGSAGGSLFMYLMGITHVDPMKYELSFERFLSLDRILTGNWPDVDVDLVDRELLVGADGRSGYLYGRWGDKAAQISTRIQLRLKSAIRDVNKYLNNGTIEPDIEKLSKALPPPPQGVSDKDFAFGFEDSDGNHIPGLIEVSPDLQKYATERPKEWELVQRCLGISRQNSKHASAFVIADVPIKSVVPVFMGNITQYEAKAVEKSKLIKYDFLVVNQLKDIQGCIARINKRAGVSLKTGFFRKEDQDLYIWDLPEDLAVYKSVWEGDTQTIFQINTQSMVPFVMKIKPRSIVDLATILALVRPGPLDFVDPDTGLTMADEYVERRNGRGTVKLPELVDLLPETFGVQVFQEQTSKVSREIGKMRPTDAEELRRIFSKKEKAKALEMKPKFMEGAVQTVGLEKAEMIWQQMETSSRYSFNLSHATAYAMITYACMYLKRYFPREWWASVLTNADEGEISTTLFKHVRDKVVPPDINLSSNEMEIDYEQNKIRAKMTVMKGLGETVAQPIVDNAPYKDIKDFIKKKVAGPSLTKKLIHVGVMDSLFPPGSPLIQKMQIYEDSVLECAYEEKLANGKNPKPPKKGEVDPEYLSMSPLQDFKAKKLILPTLPMDLSSLVEKYSPFLNEGTPGNPMFADDKGRAQKMLNGDQLFEVERRAPFEKSMYFCVPAYVVDMKEFSFQKNEKKALKLFVDIDGRISERVMWPPWEQNAPVYPKDLKKGSVVMLYMALKELRNESRVVSVKVLA